MDAHEALRARRTVPKYTGAPVPDAVIERALEAANMAPCHKLTWPWRFTVLGSEAHEALVELAIRLKAASKVDCTPDQVSAGVRAKLGSAGRLVAVSQVLDSDPFRREEDYAATAAAIQNLCLSLTADGWGSKWSTGGYTRHPDAYARLGIDPDVERIVGVVLVGEPIAEPRTPPRRPLEAVVRYVD